jgi:HTH-type transcriptional regulator/antitoxin HigA
MTIEPIRNNEDLQRAFKGLETVFHAEHGTAHAHERDALVAVIEAYENAHCDFGKADPADRTDLPGTSPRAGLR